MHIQKDFTIAMCTEPYLQQLVLTFSGSEHLPNSSMCDIFGNATRKPPVKAGRRGKGGDGKGEGWEGEGRGRDREGRGEGGMRRDREGRGEGRMTRDKERRGEGGMRRDREGRMTRDKERRGEGGMGRDREGKGKGGVRRDREGRGEGGLVLRPSSEPKQVCCQTAIILSAYTHEHCEEVCAHLHRSCHEW